MKLQNKKRKTKSNKKENKGANILVEIMTMIRHDFRKIRRVCRTPQIGSKSYLNFVNVE